ncbi:hypothetical protein ACSHWB_25350 [Lentzea sp. HUAS TT2]|uniref:hypothetical protein n=1 Tax=Lentzea sp. HUAS TT2 TaxID=3447454 RepID=UPI003F726FEF
MGVDLLPDEHVLWQGRPASRSVFLRVDPHWMRFSLKFDAVMFVLVVAVGALLSWWSGPLDPGILKVLAAVVIAPEIVRFVEPFAWRRFTLHRTTYYVTDQRVVSVPGRRARSTRLNEIEHLTFAEEPDGSGHVRLDGRYMPDGFGNSAVAELIHVPDVREVVTLLSRLSGKPANER